MDNNIQENVDYEQMNSSAEETTKKGGKKKFLIIGAIAAVTVVAVVLVLLLGGAGNGKVEIEGKSYSYSAEEGIVDVEEVCDGIVIYTGGSGKIIKPSGEAQDISGMDVLGGKYPVAFMGTMRVGDNDLAITSYNVFGEFKTSQGATHKSTVDELDKKGFAVVGDNCTVVKTNKEIIDYDDIEKDYDKIVSSNSFKDIDYMDGALMVAPDVAKIAVGGDNVNMLLDVYEKDAMMVWLAKGKAVDMLMNGDVDYVVEEGVYCPNGGVNTLYIRMYTSYGDSEKIRESMGFAK